MRLPGHETIDAHVKHAVRRIPCQESPNLGKELKR